MSPIEIFLVILGIIIVIISCIIVDRKSHGANQPFAKALPFELLYSEEDKAKMKEKFTHVLSEVSEETVIKTDDYLSRLSNEKIMAVNEFSEQIMEKIKHNHEEVVFLYNMLNDKEKELKSAVKEIDSSKKKIQEILEGRKEKDKAVIQKPATQSQNQKPKAESNEKRPLPVSEDAGAINSINANNNTQILSLYSQGKSIVEISKLLGLGQGEVKLVIDLFRGKK